MLGEYLLISGLIFLIFGLLLSFSATPFISVIHFTLAGILILIGVLNSFKKIKTNFKYKNFLLPILFLLIIIPLNILIGRQNIQYDLTEQKIYSLSAESKKILTQVKNPLKIFYVDDKNQANRNIVNSLLKLYKKEQNLITYKILNPDTANQTKSYIKNNQGSTLYFEYGEGEKAIVASLKRFNEAEISNAIYRLTNQRTGEIYFVVGHGEPNCESEAEDGCKKMIESLNQQNYQVRGLFLNASVPKDTSLLILTAAAKDYSESEKQILLEYYKRSAKILILSDPEQKNSFDFLLNPLGIKIKKDVILDQVHTLHGAAEIGWQILINDLKPHPITESLIKKQMPVIMLLASSIEYKKVAGSYAPLLLSSKTSWGETNLKDLFNEKPQAAFKEEEDIAGPLVAGLAYNNQENKSKLAIFTDTEWIKNANLQVSGNEELLINAINWLASDSSGMQIPAKLIRPAEIIPIQKSSYRKIFTVLFIVPEVLLLVLMFVWYRRRS